MVPRRSYDMVCQYWKKILEPHKKCLEMSRKTVQKIRTKSAEASARCWWSCAHEKVDKRLSATKNSDLSKAKAQGCVVSKILADWAKKRAIATSWNAKVFGSGSHFAVVFSSSWNRIDEFLLIDLWHHPGHPAKLTANFECPSCQTSACWRVFRALSRRGDLTQCQRRP